jgi:hypothetical protein
MVNVLLIAAAAATSSSVTYDCSVAPPRNLAEADGRITAHRMVFPQFTGDDWRFTLSMTRNDEGLYAVVDWPRNPIQIAGRFAGLPTADGSFAFAAYSQGPCAFTEEMCMSVVHVIERQTGQTSIVISPASMATMRETNSRAPLTVLIEGNCTRRETRS